MKTNVHLDKGSRGFEKFKCMTIQDGFKFAKQAIENQKQINPVRHFAYSALIHSIVGNKLYHFSYTLCIDGSVIVKSLKYTV